MTTRFVAMGDSFTEGVGDDDPGSPNGVRGWADRVAEQLARVSKDVHYANLAVRGRLLRDVLAQQLEPTLAMQPSLVTLYAGGNDLMRPRVDLDTLAKEYEKAIARLCAVATTVVLFTGVDGGGDTVFRTIRGRAAIYNEHVRLIAAKHGALLVDMWAMRQLRDRRMWSADRIHLNAHGHKEIAVAVLDSLAVGHDLSPDTFGPSADTTVRQRRAENLRWGWEHALPWIKRRLRGESSGDTVTAKFPRLHPVSVEPG